MLIDSHCHLDPTVFGGDAGVDEAIARARAAGVDRMITIGSGYGFESAGRALAVARRHPDVLRATVGLHPHDAKLATDDTLAELYAMADAPEVVALGEMGLDFHYDSSPRDEQRRVFRAQLAAARERQLPVIIHDRDSAGETLAVLDDEGAWEGGVLYHCYTGDVAAMEAIVSRGGYISIPGIVTFKNGDVMREVAARVPADRLLLETDSPFLTPIPFRGRRNEPAYVAYVAQKVAEVRGADVAELSEQAAANTRRFFRWE
ncbi:MAG: TatD family hydrolase [Pseudomonadota bacterium]|nr:TatD family hydrolase [Pseudomonadota bacterium]